MRLKDEQKIDLFFASTLILVGQVGLVGLTMPLIAKQSGVAIGTLYIYFKNKDDLLVSIFNTTMAEFNARAQKELAEIADPREQLRHFAQLHFLAVWRSYVGQIVPRARALNKACDGSSAISRGAPSSS